MSRSLQKKNLHSVRLSHNASLDLVWLPEDRAALLVFAEQGAIRRRTVVTLGTGQIHEMLEWLQEKLISTLPHEHHRTPGGGVPEPVSAEIEITDAVAAGTTGRKPTDPSGSGGSTPR